MQAHRHELLSSAQEDLDVESWQAAQLSKFHLLVGSGMVPLFHVAVVTAETTLREIVAPDLVYETASQNKRMRCISFVSGF